MPRCILLLMLGWCLAGSASAAGVSLLDGRELVAETLSFVGSERVRVGAEELALADCDELWFAAEPRPGVEMPAGQTVVVLIDGSWLPVAGVRGADDADDRLLLRLATGEIPADLVRVRAWGPAEWVAQHVSAAQDRSDRVLFPNEEATGEVQGISSGQLKLKSGSLGIVSRPVADIRGVILRGEAEHKSGLRLAAPLLAGRPPLYLLPGSPLRLAALPDQVFDGEIPQRLQVLGGRRVWLSDLDPAAVEEKGYFAKTWPHQRDRDLDGKPIVLDGRRYERGLVLHSRCVLRYRLDRAYESLVGRCGILDAVRPYGDCSLAISGDGRVLLERPSVNGKANAEPLRLDLRGVQELVISVGFGEFFDVADHLTLAGAFLVRAKP